MYVILVASLFIVGLALYAHCIKPVRDNSLWRKLVAHVIMHHGSTRQMNIVTRNLPVHASR